MKMNILHIAAMCTSLAVTGLAFADASDAMNRSMVGRDPPKPLNETWEVASDAQIEIGNIAGRVNVSGWDKNQVALAGSLGAGMTLDISGDARHLTLRVKNTKTGAFDADGLTQAAILNLQIPRNAALELHVVSADASVARMAGKSLKVGSVSGDLELSSAATEIDVDSVSGDVKLDAPSPNPAASTHVQTVSGEIRAKGLAGRIKLETVSGSMDCACGAVRELNTGSVSGDADITVAPEASARLHLESMSGSIRLHLPAALSARIDAATFSGSIRSDFGAVQEKEYGPGSSLKARIGAGDADISVQAFSGDVQLRKQ